MRILNFSWVTGLAVSGAVAGCGPGLPLGDEGFGDGFADESTGTDDDVDTIGTIDTETTTTDTTDTDTETGPIEECVDIDLGAQEFAFWSDFVDASRGNDVFGVCNGDGPEYVMTWTAPVTQNYRAELFSEVGAILQVQDGAGCNGEVFACGSFDFPSVAEFSAVAGQSVTFVVEAPFGDDFFDFSLSPSGQTGTCPQGFIDAVPASLAGNTNNGGSNDLSSSCGGFDAPEHGYLFIAPVTGTYHFDTFGSSFDTVLYLLAGECGGPVLNCNDDILDSVQSELLIDLEAGQLLTVVVDGFGTAAGPYQLHAELIDEPPPPPPDCDATNLPSQAPTGVTWSAIENDGDSFQGCSAFSAERRFTWTAPADGDYRFEVDAGANPGAVAVFPQGCEGDFLCDTGPDPLATVMTNVAAGQEVFVVVEWAPQQASAINLTISELGDVLGCGDPMPAGAPSFTSGTTGGAGNQFSGTCSINPSPERELWWTAPATGTYLLSLEGSAYDTLLYVRDGGCDGPELGCNDDTETMFGIELWSSLLLDLQAGQTISIFVDGFNGSGSFALSIQQQ